METKKIKTELNEVSGKDILSFDINGSKYDIDLNSEDQSNLRIIFYQIIKELFVNKMEIEQPVYNEYNKNLYKEICEEYIKQLNAEISKIYAQIPNLKIEDDVQVIMN